MSKRGIVQSLFNRRSTSFAAGPSSLSSPLALPHQCTRRYFIPRRSASSTFWTQNFPHVADSSSSTNYTLYVPTVLPVAQGTAVPASPLLSQSTDHGAKKREKKQRYLDNLMDKAGELSLRCTLPFDPKWHGSDAWQAPFSMHRGTGRLRRDAIRSPSCVESMIWTYVETNYGILVLKTPASRLAQARLAHSQSRAPDPCPSHLHSHLYAPYPGVDQAGSGNCL